MPVGAILSYRPLIFNLEMRSKTPKTTKTIERVFSGEAFHRTKGKPTHKYIRIMRKTKKLISEELIKMINLNEALESHNNDCSLFAVSMLSLIIGWDAEEDPRFAFMSLVNSKKLLPMKELQDATGLSKSDCFTIFDTEDDRRWLMSDAGAVVRMSDHLKRSDLLPHQRAISKLLFKIIGGKVMEEIKSQYHRLTGKSLEKQYCYDVDFQREAYNISLDELNEAMRLYFIHIFDLQPRVAETIQETV